MQRLCPRCRNAVTIEDEGTLCFCGNCGAPQVRLSQELQDEINTAREAFTTGQETANAEPAREPEPGAVNWRGAILCAAFAGAVALLLEFLSMPVPPLTVVSSFWVLTAPVLTLALYQSRFRQTTIRPAFGARLGLLVGIAISLAILIATTGETLLRRYAFHSAGLLDTQMQDTFTRLRTQFIQQYGAAAAAPLISWLAIPDFRAGIMLSGFAMVVVGYLLFALAFGALGGLLRARRPLA
jgi:hypothetical protein